jgi:hypothetical protein
MVVDDHVGVMVAGPAEGGEQEVNGDPLRVAGIGAPGEDPDAAGGVGTDA